MVELLTLHGAGVNVKDNNGQTAIRIASQLGHEESLAVLMRHDTEMQVVEDARPAPTTLFDQAKGVPMVLVPWISDNNAPSNSISSTIDSTRQPTSEEKVLCIQYYDKDSLVAQFLKAVKTKDLITADRVLRNASIEALHAAWIWACDHVQHESIVPIVMVLLNNKAPIDAVDPENRSMLYRAVEQDHHSLVELLIGWKADLEIELSGGRSLEQAVKANNETKVHLLLHCGADANRVLQLQDSKSEVTVLHITLARCKTHKALLPLLLQYKPSLQIRFLDGDTPLELATSLDIREAVEMLIEAGANVNDKAVRLAIRNSNLATVRLLLRSGIRAGNLEDLLYWTIRRHQFSTSLSTMVKILLESCGEKGGKSSINVNFADESGGTSLHHILWTPDSQLKLSLVTLIEAGADIKAKNSLGWTPLHYAAACGKAFAVQTLLEHGADMSARAHGGKTALDLAESSGHGNVMELLTLAKQKKTKGGSLRASPPEEIARSDRRVDREGIEKDTSKMIMRKKRWFGRS